MYERTFWLDHVEDQGGEVIRRARRWTRHTSTKWR